jgi:hypothetical protein
LNIHIFNLIVPQARKKTCFGKKPKHVFTQVTANLNGNAVAWVMIDVAVAVDVVAFVEADTEVFVETFVISTVDNHDDAHCIRGLETCPLADDVISFESTWS